MNTRFSTKYKAATSVVPMPKARGRVRRWRAQFFGDVGGRVPAAVSQIHKDQADTELLSQRSRRAAHGVRGEMGKVAAPAAEAKKR